MTRQKQKFAAAAAPKNPDFTFDFEREVAHFYAAHPAYANEIVFIDPAAALFLCAQGVDTAGMLARVAEDKELTENILLCLNKGVCTAGRYDDFGRSCVVMNAAAEQKGDAIFAANIQRDRANAFVFDHETAHLICPDGYEPFNIRECVADAYAAIRQFQRFGMEAAPYLKSVAEMRAIELVFRSDEGEHFTSPVILKIVSDAAKSGFVALSPEDTIRVARRYALSHAMNEMFVRYTSDRFGGFKDRLSELTRGNMDALHELGAFLKTTTAPAEFKWGLMAFRALLDSKANYDGTVISPDREIFRETLAYLEKREKNYARTGDIFFGIKKTLKKAP